MKKYFLSLGAIALLSAGTAKAQKDSTKLKKEIRIEKHMNGDRPEKTIIVIDGDKVIVNGEEVEGLKDLRGKLHDMRGNFNFDLEAV
jgi:hypothetical protein